MDKKKKQINRLIDKQVDRFRNCSKAEQKKIYIHKEMEGKRNERSRTSRNIMNVTKRRERKSVQRKKEKETYGRETVFKGKQKRERT